MPKSLSEEKVHDFTDEVNQDPLENTFPDILSDFLDEFIYPYKQGVRRIMLYSSIATIALIGAIAFNNLVTPFVQDGGGATTNNYFSAPATVTVFVSAPAPAAVTATVTVQAAEQ